MQEYLQGAILVVGQRVSDVRFTDDQGMVSNTESWLQKLMDKLNETAKKFSMKNNIQKTSTMLVCRDGGGQTRRVMKRC